MIHIVTIGGSARPGNYTAKALALVQQELGSHDDVEVTAIDPAVLKLAIPGTAMDSSDRDWLRETVASADGVVLATPEYHGTFSSLMKLVIENLGALVLPNPVSVARVRTVFDDHGNCLDAAMEQSIRGLAASLVEYIRDTTCPQVSLEQRVRAETW
jgi:chromate reductase